MSKDKSDKNWFAQHKILTIIGVLVLLVIGASALGGNSDDPSVSKQDGTSLNDQARSDQKKEYAVGEAITVDNRTLTIDSVERNYQTGNEFSQPESGKEFVVVTVSIANNGDKPLDYNTFDFKMQDSNGVQQDEAFTALTEGKLNSGSLAAGGKVTGKLAYQVPVGDANLKLLFTNLNLFNNKTITIKL